MSKEKETKETPLTKEEKAAEAKDLYTREFIRRIENMIGEFVEEFQIKENLTGTDRRRLTGAGVRNNGFMDKAFDIILDNPEFMPPNFDISILRWNMREMEDFRQLFLVLQQFTQLASNAYLTQADHCYREARANVVGDAFTAPCRNRRTTASPAHSPSSAPFKRSSAARADNPPTNPRTLRSSATSNAYSTAKPTARSSLKTRPRALPAAFTKS